VSRALIAVWFAVALVMVSTESIQAAPDEEPFGVMAEELWKGLTGGPAGTGPLRVAIWPFDEETSPVSPELGREYNGRFLARLLERVRRSPDKPRVRFVEREELGTIIEEVRETTVFDDVGNPVAACTCRRSYHWTAPGGFG
jgi:hypothetical protein